MVSALFDGTEPDVVIHRRLETYPVSNLALREPRSLASYSDRR